jgi:hypothetical protein
VTKLLVSRQDAADSLSICLRHFEKKVQPHVRTVRIGKRVLVLAEDVERLVRERAR